MNANLSLTLANATVILFFCVYNDNNAAQKCKILLQAKYLNVGMIFFC